MVSNTVSIMRAAIRMPRLSFSLLMALVSPLKETINPYLNPKLRLLRNRPKMVILIILKVNLETPLWNRFLSLMRRWLLQVILRVYKNRRRWLLVFFIHQIWRISGTTSSLHRTLMNLETNINTFITSLIQVLTNMINKISRFLSNQAGNKWSWPQSS